MPRFLHIGCGSKYKDRTTAGFGQAEWIEVRLDVDPECRPDIIASMLDMKPVATGSMDACFSSHNLEHLYAHEVPIALAEFRRVLAPQGFAIITCPDLQSVSELIAGDRLDEPAYTSPAGPISPLDMLYGHRPSLAAGKLYMAHRTGFTLKTLLAALQHAGFASTAGLRRPGPAFDLWILAAPQPASREQLAEWSRQHFPQPKR